MMTGVCTDGIMSSARRRTYCGSVVGVNETYGEVLADDDHQILNMYVKMITRSDIEIYFTATSVLMISERQTTHSDHDTVFRCSNIHHVYVTY